VRRKLANIELRRPPNENENKDAKDELIKGAWTKEEREQFYNGVKTFGYSSNFSCPVFPCDMAHGPMFATWIQAPY
jgi:hypothetical protein